MTTKNRPDARVAVRSPLNTRGISDFQVGDEGVFGPLLLVPGIVYSGECQPPGDGLQENGLVHDRFGHIVVEALCQEFFPVSGHGMGGKGNDRRVLQLFLVPDPPKHVRAVHVGKRDVQENEIGIVLNEALQGAGPGFVFGEIVEVLQESLHQKAVVRIVFDDGDSRLHPSIPSSTSFRASQAAWNSPLQRGE